MTHDVEVYSLEMAWRFVVFGIADRAKGMMSFQRNLAKGRIGMGERSCRECAPFGYSPVEMGGCIIERKLHTH